MDKRTLPLSLGATVTGHGVHFAVRAPHAEEVLLCLEGGKIPLNRRGDLWEVEVKNLQLPAPYTYTVDGTSGLLDPYAKAFTDTESWVREGPYHGKGLVCAEEEFDWEEIASPNRPLSELVIYELSVRTFTLEADVAEPGTFLGLIGVIPYLQELGINAVELLPVYEFDPCAYQGRNPETGQRLKNIWGYGSLGLFAPMSGYAYRDPIDEFKTLVREMHRAGIEVILDVVYNHTGPGPALLYTQSPSYYLMSEGGHMNFSGCGNTLACNREPTMGLILDSLHYWAKEMGVDGFRFDLASILTRGEGGDVLDDPPLLKAIREDPLLSQKKLIAEPWDCGGLYQLGEFPKWGPWSEWNGAYRDTVRRFIRGADQQEEAFSAALRGHGGRINFVTAHDGFSLTDLVSYNAKHNEANGEDNRDGSDYNESWNCGVEGQTSDPTILALRARQKRNFFLALLIGRAAPMIRMGDEMGKTYGGNNNTWCQDIPFPWEGKGQDRDLFRFVQGLIAFRKGHPLLKNDTPLTHSVIDKRFVSFTLGDLYIAFNADSEEREVVLPDGKPWLRIIDTALLPPYDFSEEEGAFPLDPNHSYKMASYSALLLKKD